MQILPPLFCRRETEAHKEEAVYQGHTVSGSRTLMGDMVLKFGGLSTDLHCFEFTFIGLIF